MFSSVRSSRSLSLSSFLVFFVSFRSFKISCSSPTLYPSHASPPTHLVLTYPQLLPRLPKRRLISPLPFPYSISTSTLP